MRFRAQRGAGISPQRATETAVGLLLADYPAENPTAMTEAGRAVAALSATVEITQLTPATGYELVVVPVVAVGERWIFRHALVGQRDAIGTNYIRAQFVQDNGSFVGLHAGLHATNSGILASRSLDVNPDNTGAGAEAQFHGSSVVVVTLAGALKLRFYRTAATAGVTLRSGSLVEGWRIA